MATQTSNMHNLLHYKLIALIVLAAVVTSACSKFSEMAVESAATTIVKERLRSPSSFKLQTFKIIKSAQGANGKTHYVTAVAYEAQNNFGVHLPGCEFVIFSIQGETISYNKLSATQDCTGYNINDNALMALAGEAIAERENFPKAPSQAAVEKPTNAAVNEAQKSAVTPPTAGGFPELPAANKNPNPKTSGNQFPGVVAKKTAGLTELIGATPKLEDAIDELLKNNSSEFFSRLTGPSESPAPDGKDAIFGKGCMAHSCGSDPTALYVRENGAVALAYVNSDKNQLVYATNIAQKDGLPDPMRKFVASAMEENPGLLLVGIETTNGITKVPEPTQGKAPTVSNAPTQAPAPAPAQAPKPTAQNRVDQQLLDRCISAAISEGYGDGQCAYTYIDKCVTTQSRSEMAKTLQTDRMLGMVSRGCPNMPQDYVDAFSVARKKHDRF